MKDNNNITKNVNNNERESVREVVINEISNYKYNLKRIDTLSAYLQKADSETDAIDAIVYAKHVNDSDLDGVEKDRTPLAAIEYKRVSEDLYNEAVLELSALKHRVWLLENTIALLPERERAVLEGIVSGWTYDEVCYDQNISRKTVAALKRSAIELLTDKYMKYWPAEVA